MGHPKLKVSSRRKTPLVYKGDGFTNVDTDLNIVLVMCFYKRLVTRINQVSVYYSGIADILLSKDHIK